MIGEQRDIVFKTETKNRAEKRSIILVTTQV